MLSEPEDGPLITVLLPVYNAMPYLPAAIQSLLQQTEQRIRIVAINDGSTDSSGGYLSSLSDRRVRVVTQNNGGLVAALNRGLHEVNTQFIARMDADDVSHPQRLQRQLLFLMNRADCDLVGCSANHIGKSSDIGSWPVFMPERHEDILAAMLKRKSAIIHATIFARAEAFARAGEYSAEAWPAEDYEMFFRIGVAGRLANIPEALYSIRLHETSITARAIMKGQRQYEAVCERYRPGFSQVQADRLNHSIALVPKSVRLAADVRAVFFYRQGVTKFVNGKPVHGFLFLLFSAIFSPWRAWEYLKRRIQSRQPHAGSDFIVSGQH